MKYGLHRDFRLRGWKDDPFCLERFSTRELRRLTPEEFAFFLRCDGQTELAADDWPPRPEWALRNGIVYPARDGEALLPEQQYHCYPNCRLNYLELSVTGRCNFNCKHCFFAADTQPRPVEPSMDRLLSLLARMDDCGIGQIRLNGGEPLMRRDLLDFTEEMARRGIRLHTLISNGSLITSSFLDALEAQGHHPIWFIRYDGLSHHDWLRGVRGAEETVLRNIRLLCERGAFVQVHQCVWRDSLASIHPTVLKLRDLGVSRYRITTVEPSLRWMQTAPEQSISTEEWQAYLPGFLEWWYETGIEMDLDVWSYWVITTGAAVW